MEVTLGVRKLFTVTVDALDVDLANNYRENLRLVTQAQNLMNTRKRLNNKSGYKGVSWHKAGKMWQARISVAKKQINLGLYKDIVEAAKAYDEAARKHFGKYACVNFPKEGERSAI